MSVTCSESTVQRGKQLGQYKITSFSKFLFFITSILGCSLTVQSLSSNLLMGCYGDLSSVSLTWPVQLKSYKR